MKRVFPVLFFALLTALGANAQSAQKITEIDEAVEISYGQFCYLIGTSTSTVDDSATYLQAFETIRKTGVFRSDVMAIDPIPLYDIALLCSKTWNIKGSLLYMATKSARYAFKQMQALDMIPLTADPMSPATGHQVLNIITKCIDYSSEQ